MGQIGSLWQEFVGISKTTNTDGMNPMIDVFVPEFLPNADGCLPHKVEHIGGTKCPFSATCGQYDIFTHRIVKAVFRGDANHLVPCIHEGERVKLLNYAGTEQYYWEAMGRDPGLRRHERIRWYAMARPSSVVSPTFKDVKDTDSYFIEFNTNIGKKEFHIHTSKLETEHHPYDMHILPEKGMFILRDDIMNEIKLWSDDHKWRWENTDESYIEIDKKNITIFCKDTFTLIAGEHIKQFAGNSWSVHAPVHSCTGETRQSSFSTRDWFTAKTHAFDDDNMVIRDKKQYTQKAMKSEVTIQTSHTFSAATADWTANHTFMGGSFQVFNSSGYVPVVICLGSNTW